MVNQYLRLFLISFTILFLELLLIRFISTEIRIFAYLSNLVLLTVFVGIGLGMIIKKKIPLYLSSIFLALITGILVTGLFSSITELVSPLSESFVWFQSGLNTLSSAAWGIILTTLVLLIILFIFIPLGRALGDIFQNSNKPILLYSLDIIASLLGMWVFYSLSFLNISPLVGLVLIQVLLLFLIEKQKTFLAVLSACFALYFLFLNQNTSQLAAGMNGSQKNFPGGILRSLLRSSSLKINIKLVI